MVGKKSYDTIKITDFYASVYPKWYPLVKDKIAIVKAFKIKSSALDKEVHPVYIAKYDVRKEYECLEMQIYFEGGRDCFSVSNLRFALVEG